MVKEFHRAGIEVILDVVYNHTAEGNHLGPTLSFRGIDNVAYYRLTEDRRFYKDYTGTGNSLNMRHPRTLQLIMDSLRYWILEMHVDGFRFDLAATLARELHEVDRLSAFFDIIQQDPVISCVKLIAEPWDVGEGGYQVGNFPPLWSEWNGKYRDCVRDYWRGADQTLNEFAARLTGSSDLYAWSGRRPYASINFVTAHDGFTLNDLVSYNEKHNQANGEDNRDGESNNRSWNCGAEGPSDDPEINSAACAPEAQLHRHADVLAGRAHAAGRRRNRPHSARQQQRILPGQRDFVDSSGTRPIAICSSSRASRSSFAKIIATSAAADFSRAVRFAAMRSATSDGSSPTANRCPMRTGTADSPNRSACTSMATPSEAWIIAASRSKTTASTCCSMRITTAMDFILPDGAWGTRFEKVFDTNTRENGRAPALNAGSKVRIEARSLAVLRRVE